MPKQPIITTPLGTSGKPISSGINNIALSVFIAVVVISTLLSLTINSQTLLSVTPVLQYVAVSIFILLYFLQVSTPGKLQNTSWYGLILAASVLVVFSMTHSSAYSSVNTPNVSSFFIPITTSILSLAMFAVFSGSLTQSGQSVYLIGSLFIVLFYAMYLSTTTSIASLGTPAPPVQPSNGYFGNNSNSSIYTNDRMASETNPDNRSLVDFTYLTVAYPTLHPKDTIPIPNTSDVYGNHSIMNYQDVLNKGATALYFDIYYQDSDIALSTGNTVKTNLNTWRIGTLNTLDGTVQNKRTISLASVLAQTQATVDVGNGGTGRTYFLILNPRYTTTQMKKGTESMENDLATVIHKNVRSCGLPPLAEQGSGSNTFINLSNTRINQANNQIVFIIGGPKPISSQSLLTTVQGSIDLQKVYLQTTDALPAGPENALSYTPGVGQASFGEPSVMCSNSINADKYLVSQNRSKSSVINGTTSQPRLVMMFPDNANGMTTLYEDIKLPHIVYGASFPVVYPSSLSPTGYIANKNLLNGYSYEPTRNSSQIRSYTWDNTINADSDENITSFVDSIKYCKNSQSNIMEPGGSSQSWNTIMNPSIQKKTKWCDEFTKTYSTQVFLARPLELYRPRASTASMNTSRKKNNVLTIDLNGKTDVVGYVPKPAVIDYWGQTSRNGIYILRSIVVHGKAYGTNPAT